MWSRRGPTFVTTSLEAIIATSNPPRPARLGAIVLATLADKIASGELAPGTTLPTELALCQAFGVSRTVIRESFKVLEEKGLVRVKQGQGTTVEPPERWNLLDPLVLEAAIRHDETLRILDDLIDVRVALEQLMARAAAERMTDAELDGLGDALARLEGLLDSTDAYLVADGEFHDMIHIGSGNRLGRSIVRSIHQYARGSTRYHHGANTTRDDIVSSHRGHAAIYARLRARDADGAATAMQDHIMQSWLARKSRTSNATETFEPFPSQRSGGARE
jgi:DNA-binding FadR family transcriptional regulator